VIFRGAAKAAVHETLPRATRRSLHSYRGSL
jgi:hypothetical protein